MKVKTGIIIFIASLSIFSCTDNKEIDQKSAQKFGYTTTEIDECDQYVDISGIDVKGSFERTDLTFRNMKSAQEVNTFLQNNKNFVEAFGNIDGLPYNQMVPMIYGLHHDNRMNVLYKDIDKAWSNTKDLEEQLNLMYRHIKYYDNKFSPKKVSTVNTAFAGIEIYPGKKEFIIALDYFMGPKATYEPMDPYHPKYLQQFNQIHYIPSKLASKYADEYIQINKGDNTFLNKMIAFGKKYYFAHCMMPCVHDSIILEYDNKEIGLLRKHREQIYNHFVTNSIFYSNKDEFVRKLLMPSPKCVQISDECPGRAGIWLGYEIIKAYMKNNPTLTAMDLMKEKSAKKIFEGANFKEYMKEVKE